MSHYGGNNGYPQPGQGEAASYYNDQLQQQYPPNGQQQQYPQNGQQHSQQYPQHGQQQLPQYDQRYPSGHQLQGLQGDGPDGERGVMGAIGGGVAGGFGGHAVGGRTNHSKLGTVLGVVGGAFAGHKLEDGVSDWKDKRDDEKKAEEEKKKAEEEKKKAEERKKNEKHEEKKECHQTSTSHVKFLGNFSGSSRDIRIDACGEYTLHASCRRTDGSYQASSISLNKILSNDRGHFRWVEAEKQDKVTPGPRQYTVMQGDTLRAIATKVGGSFEEIAKANGIQNPDLIYPGQVLNIPGAAFETSGSCGGGIGNFGHSARNVELVDGKRLEGELLRDGKWVGSSIMLDERIGNENGTLTFKS